MNQKEFTSQLWEEYGQEVLERFTEFDKKHDALRTQARKQLPSFKQAAAEKIKIVFLENLKTHPEETYQDVLDFLNLTSTGKTDFGVYNQNAQWRSPWLRSVTNVLKQGKKKLGITKNLGLVSFLRTIGMAHQPHQKLSSEFHQELEGYFADEIRKVIKITGVDVSHWNSAHTL